MREAVILSACRTPIGKFRGSLSALSATELGAKAIEAAVRAAGVPPEHIEEAIMGCVLPAGLGQAPARQAALKAGLAPRVAALTVNKVCGSGLKAAMLAAQAVRAGDADFVVAGGMESMSRAPFVAPRDGAAYGDRALIDTVRYDGLTCATSALAMGDIADKLAARIGALRADQDAFSAESHRRAVAAAAAGWFDAEIVPLKVKQGKAETTVDRDEGPRADTTAAGLAGLRLAFTAGGGTVTPGNASTLSDGAAAAVIASREAAERLGRKPLARIVSYATSGGPPEDLFTAPVDAIRAAVAKAGLRLADIDLFEINEAFAAQMLACLRPLEITQDRVNVNGGAIALGHPIGASGARVLATLVHALRRRGAKTGVAALCLGGGNAVAMLVESC